MFLGNGVQEICSKFTGEYPCRNAISIKLFCNLIKITLRHGCSPVICCIFSEHLFLRTLLGGRHCSYFRNFDLNLLYFSIIYGICVVNKDYLINIKTKIRIKGKFLVTLVNFLLDELSFKTFFINI